MCWLNTTYLIANYEQTNKSTALQTKPNLVLTQLSLPNAGFNLILIDGLNTQIDHAGTGSKPIAGGTLVNDNGEREYRSMVRINVDTFIQSNEWQNSKENKNVSSEKNFMTPGLHKPKFVTTEAKNQTEPHATKQALDSTQKFCVPTDHDTTNDLISKNIEHINEGPETPSTKHSLSGLRIHSLYPNTLGEDASEEYIEIINDTESSTNTLNWYITDASGKTYMFENYEMQKSEVIRLMRDQTKIALNNTNEMVHLHNPEQKLVDTATYESTIKGETYTSIDGIWTWSENVSKNEPKTLSINTNQQPAELQDQKSTHGIKKALTFEDGEKTTITGTVTTKPNNLGKQIAYIQDQNSGIQIYKHDAKFGEMNEGDVITVSGELSSVKNQRRLKIPSGEIDLLKTSGKLIEPKQIASVQTETKLIGLLVQTKGKVVSVSGNHILLEDTDGQIDVFVTPLSKIDLDIFEIGSQLTITGILTQDNDTFRIQPRDNHDIERINSESSIAGSMVNKSNEPQNLATLYILLSTIILLGLVLRKHIKNKRIAYATNNIS